jgi:hypothetical protein
MEEYNPRQRKWSTQRYGRREIVEILKKLTVGIGWYITMVLNLLQRGDQGLSLAPLKLHQHTTEGLVEWPEEMIRRSRRSKESCLGFSYLLMS